MTGDSAEWPGLVPDLLVRASGVLAHVTSLPSRYGIGDLGPEADAFLSMLVAARQRYWQVLPIAPTGYADSPYQSLSTFGINPLLISPASLLDDGLIVHDDLNDLAALPADHVDFGAVIHHKRYLLEKAARNLRLRATPDRQEQYLEFRRQHGDAWLFDYSLYAALKRAHDLRPWPDWDHDVASRQPDAVADARLHLRDEIELQEILQFLCFEQWERLRDRAAAAGIALVGDLPLYVAHDSADVWARPELFQVGGDGKPTVIAGVPPDYFSETGQRWGNPIYDWPGMERDGFTWWRARMRHLLALFDVVRIDHFRGIAGYWEIPASEPTAIHGRWLDGPGEALLGALEDDLGGELPVVAEDLGVITEDVTALRANHALPGMRVAQFGFDEAPDSAIHDPYRFPADVWGYCGTHDNDTTEGWFWKDNPERDPALVRGRRRELLERVGERSVGWGLIEMVAASAAVTAVFSVQDLLGLGSDGRMNTPGTTSGNWRWRFLPGQLTPAIIDRLANVVTDCDRAVGTAANG